MKNFNRFFSLSVIVLITILISSCQNDELPETSGTLPESQSPDLKSSSLNTFYSSTISFGKGVVRAYVTVNKDGEPVETGIALTEKALTNLPDHAVQHVLTLPKNKGSQFYTHVLFDWNPGGHEPPGVYDLPHFDVHFYIVPDSYRKTIPPMMPPNFDTAPDPVYVPADYVQFPGLVPQMGAHWADETSPELNGQMFTHTFLWGSYGGEFIFWEPMITLDFLLTNPDDTYPVKQPEKYQKDGWYPMNYGISASDSPGEYIISLKNLTWHEGEVITTNVQNNGPETGL